MGRILSGKCTGLCYKLEYRYIVQIAAQVLLSTCKTRSNILPDPCCKQTQDLCASLLLYNIAIFQYVTQNYIYKTIYAPLHHSRNYTNVCMYTLVSEVHVCIKAI